MTKKVFIQTLENVTVQKKNKIILETIWKGGILLWRGKACYIESLPPPPLYSFRNNFHREISLYDHSFGGKSYYIASLPGEVSLWGNVLLYSQPFGSSRTLGEGSLYNTGAIVKRAIILVILCRQWTELSNLNFKPGRGSTVNSTLWNHKLTFTIWYNLI